MKDLLKNSFYKLTRFVSLLVSWLVSYLVSWFKKTRKIQLIGLRFKIKLKTSFVFFNNNYSLTIN